MVSKVQLLNLKKNNEIEIGKLIIGISQYESYFAPIISSCPVNINVLPNSAISKCKIMENANKMSKQEYITNKIRFIGNLSLEEYIIKVSNNENTGYKVIKQTMIHLLLALDKLYNTGIIHYDLSKYNILYDENNHSPIIIDFGLSIIPSVIKQSYNFKSFSTAFYTFQIYPYWCIEIYMISYIINNNYPSNIYSEELGKTYKSVPNNTGIIQYIFGLKPVLVEEARNNQDQPNITDLEPKSVTKEKIEEIIDSFINTNELFKIKYLSSETNQFKTKLEKYFSKYIGQENWKQILDDLFQEINYSTWDNYSLAAVYLIIIQHDNFKKYENNINIQKITEYLKGIVLAIPSERLTIKNTDSFIKSL